MDRDPLVGPPPAEVPLPEAPLVRVLAQVRFPPILKIEEERAFVAGFQDEIRTWYPFLAQEKGQQVLMTPAEVQFTTQSIWRFADLATNWKWRVSLGPDFLSLETTAYHSREDFLDRFAVLLVAGQSTLRPGPATRVGLRYIDRLTGPALDRIATLVDPCVLGVLPTPLGQRARLSVGEALVEAPDDRAELRLRFGLLPPDTTLDPMTIPAIPDKSWILDLDMYDNEQRPFIADAITGRTRAFAERIYSVFRALVTPAFLQHYGGKP